ncbi:MAG: YhbY family RNA-binding protein [Oscillospiraceae bacterium]|nr:YhbY family RNA-binding protein [Oscillospiraceae bacterium]
MTLSSKQRAQLRGIANSAETLIHIGKGGVTEAVVQQANEAFAPREIIKGKVLENAPLTPREACDALAAACGAASVQVIGSKFVLYRPNMQLEKDKRIRLVKD